MSERGNKEVRKLFIELYDLSVSSTAVAYIERVIENIGFRIRNYGEEELLKLQINWEKEANEWNNTR